MQLTKLQQLLLANKNDRPPLLKKTLETGVMSKVVECLLSRCQALSSILSIRKRKGITAG
jgi:hypothetical protein